jgi:hypothetical protein
VLDYNYHGTLKLTWEKWNDGPNSQLVLKLCQSNHFFRGSIRSKRSFEELHSIESFAIIFHIIILLYNNNSFEVLLFSPNTDQLGVDPKSIMRVQTMTWHVQLYESSSNLIGRYCCVFFPLV